MAKLPSKSYISGKTQNQGWITAEVTGAVLPALELPHECYESVRVASICRINTTVAVV